MKITIIGAGPGGYETALCAAAKGVEVVLVEASKAGGTCLNEGCIPTKSLFRSAQVMDMVSDAGRFGVEPNGCVLDLAKVMARKDAVVEQLRSGVETLLKHKNITYVSGKASFKDAHTVLVDTPDGEVKEYSSDKVIVATGSTPAFLPVEGIELPGVLTSSQILELQEVPERLCVIGGGVIGLELASIFNSFGAKVTVLEFCKDILPRFDADISKRLRQALGKRGIEIVTQAQVTGISLAEGGTLSVSYLRKGASEEVDSDKVLMAVGRRPAVDSLNFADVGVTFTPKGVIVNEFMQTTNPDIYAVGDITGGMMLAHAATFQGRKALGHILGEKDGIDLSVVPAAVFTTPQAAMVGKTEEDCKAEGIDFTVLKSFYRANGKAVSMECTDGLCKVIAEKATGRILGCHILGEEAPDLVHEAMVLINAEVTLDRFSDFIHAHPTLSEILQSVR